MRKINLAIKRCIDIIGSLLGLILFSPVILIIALLIKVTSPGTVFFRQERLGYKGKVFKIIKFRTMVTNAEHMGTGLKVKDDSDERITKVGHVLRRTSLDEIPQLINVLKGDMSLVGPRPPATYHPYKGYEGYPDMAKKRFDMRPGMTGLAQAKVRNTVTWDERIKYDVEYVKNFNVIFDMMILAQTFLILFDSKNIYANK